VSRYPVASAFAALTSTRRYPATRRPLLTCAVAGSGPQATARPAEASWAVS
jgi:hypothetical protein